VAIALFVLEKFMIAPKKSPFTDMLEAVLGNHLKDNLHTSVPGHVLQFDPDTQLAGVQIGLLRTDVGGSSFAPSPIVEVPVQFAGGAGGSIEFKIEPGDEGLIVFSQRCIDEWVNRGGVAPTNDLRRFSANDAVFIPGVRSQKGALANFENNGVRLRNKAGTRHVWLKDDGSLVIVVDSIDVTGPATFNDDVFTMADIQNQGVSIGKDHRHGGVQSGGSNTGIVT
jgi:hypothetical protein